MNCQYLGFSLIFSVFLIISFLEYRNGGESFLFKDKTEIELLKRKNQKMIEQLKNYKLKKQLSELENDK